jgi:hypothetical protein
MGNIEARRSSTSTEDQDRKKMNNKNFGQRKTLNPKNDSSNNIML